MPQWRKLHLKIVDSHDFNDLPDDFCRLTWTLLPLALDSEGRAHDDAGWMRSKLYPMRRDVSLEMIEATLISYAERGMIFRYEVSGRHYLHVPTFNVYQGKTDREAASVIPEPVKRTRKTAKSTLPVHPQSQSGPTHDLVRTGSMTDSDVDAEEIRIEKPTTAPGRRTDPIFDAIVEVCSIDVSIQGAGSSVGKVATALKKASPPYTSSEILEWGQEQAWRSSPPTVWQLKQGVSSIRKPRQNGHSPQRTASQELHAMGYVDANGKPI